MVKQQILYKYPPDITKAQKHRLSNRIFKGVQKDPACQQCQCCDRKIGVQQVESSCCYDKNQLAFLGPGIPLFFAYLRNCILLLLSFALIFSGFCIYSNFSSSNCTVSSTDCQYNIFNTISLANKINSSDLLSIQNYILVAFVTVNVFLFQLFRYNFRQIQQECDDIVTSPSDYAIILRRLPQNITQQDIQKMVQQRRQELNQQQKKKTQNLKIDHIVMSYAMGQYTRIKQANLQKFKQLIGDDKHAQFKPQPLPKLTQTAKLAIIVFTKQQSKQFFLYKPSIAQKFLQLMCDPCTPLSNVRVKDERISIQRAPQPDDVVWQNSKISISGAIVRKSIFNVIGFLVLMIGGAAQYGLVKLQQQVTNQLEKQIYSIGLSIIVSIFNFIILQVLIISSHKQRNETLTQFNTVLTVKISFFQFLNTGIFVVLVNFLADMDSFTITETLPSDVTIVMLTNAITPNLSLWLMNYFEISGKIFRWLIKTQRMKVTQMQANETWQGPLPQIPFKYAYILKTIWLTAFYAPLVPVVVPISMIGLALNYFIQKHLYRFVYSVPNTLSSMVNDSAIELMQYFPLIMSVGQFIIYLYMKHYDVIALPVNWSIPIYISLALSFLNLMLPMDQFNKRCFKLKNDDAPSQPYEKVQNKFEVTYQMTNPAYECKKKRKRDVFLFNHIFGGEGKNIAMNISGFLGVNDTNRSMVKDPLLNKNDSTAVDNNILGRLLNQNDQIPQKNNNETNLPPTDKRTNNINNQQIVSAILNNNNAIKEQQNNPFAAFMKLNAMTNQSNKQQNNPNNTTLTSVPSKTALNPIQKQPSKKVQTNIAKVQSNVSKVEQNNIKTSKVQQNAQKIGLNGQNTNQNSLKTSQTKNNEQNNRLNNGIQSNSTGLNNNPVNNSLKGSNVGSTQVNNMIQKNQYKNSEQQKKGLNEYKNITKDLQYKYNNNNSNSNLNLNNNAHNNNVSNNNLNNNNNANSNKSGQNNQANGSLIQSKNNNRQSELTKIPTNTGNSVNINQSKYANNKHTTQQNNNTSNSNNNSNNIENALNQPIKTYQNTHNLQNNSSANYQNSYNQNENINRDKNQPINSNHNQKTSLINYKQTNAQNHITSNNQPHSQAINNTNQIVNNNNQIANNINNAYSKPQQKSNINPQNNNTINNPISTTINNPISNTIKQTQPVQSYSNNQPRLVNQSQQKTTQNINNQVNQMKNSNNQTKNVSNNPSNQNIYNNPSSENNNNLTRQLQSSNIRQSNKNIQNNKLTQNQSKPNPTQINNYINNQSNPISNSNALNNTNPINNSNIQSQPLSNNQTIPQSNPPKLQAIKQGTNITNTNNLINSVSQTPKQKSPSKNKPNPKQQQKYMEFLNNFPNLPKQLQISKKTKQKFMQDGKSQLSYQNKRFTKNGAVFFQSPQSTPKSTFPHVQIYVPGIKPTKNQQVEQKRRFNHNKTNKKQNISNKKQQYSEAEIYNPRFSQKQPIDIDKFYGPPDTYGKKKKETTQNNPKKFQQYFS